MKVCVTSTDNSSESLMDQRFGRAAYFFIKDTDSDDFEIIENSASIQGGGGGITSGQLMIEKGVSALITGNVGPNAMNVLNAAGIEIYHGTNETVTQNLHNFKKGLLEKVTKTVPSHYGLGRTENRS